MSTEEREDTADTQDAVEPVRHTASGSRAEPFVVDDAEPGGPESTNSLSVHDDAPVTRRPFVRIGIYAWALVGIGLALWGLEQVVALVSVVVTPLILALFPAAILYPPTRALKQFMPDALATLLVLLVFFGALAGLFTWLAPQVMDEFDNLTSDLQSGIDQLQDFVESGPFGLPEVETSQLVDQARERLTGSGIGSRLGSSALSVASSAATFGTSLILMLFALFFYLKDGPFLARALRNVFPRRFRADAAQIGTRAWNTVGGYIQGQLLIALIDAVFIGIGLLILGIPLAVPLAVFIFFGALFPIIGAFAGGALAVVVALASSGFTDALIVLAIIIGVQQLEGNVFAPVILGRAVELHPLVTISVLTAGAILLGVLGAFLAVPVTAAVFRAADYLRERVPG